MRTRAAAAIILAATCFMSPAKTWSGEARVLRVALEQEVGLLSLELPANKTDRVQVGDTMDSFARRYAFQAGDPNSPIWNIQRLYIGPNDEIVVLSLFPEHTFVGLSKRPGDAESHQNLVDALRAAFTPFGFKPWVEPPD